jgi:excisionase family DNA binding protein
MTLSLVRKPNDSPARARKPKAKKAAKVAPAPLEKLLYRRQEVAFKLGLSVRSVDAMIADKRLRSRRFGRCILIPACDVQRVYEKILASDMLEGVARQRA